MSVTALQAAKRACQVSGWTLTNLQLQKILYVASMIHAGKSGNPELISDENFQAWNYGPVLPSVYRQVSAFGSKPIKNVFHSIRDISEDSGEAKMIDSAVEKLSGVPPFRLVEIVHDSKSAWRRHYNPRARGVTIHHSDVVAEYNSRFPRAEAE